MTQMSFGGSTYIPERDGKRLGRQALKVWETMADEDWHTLSDISRMSGAPEASVSARIRDFRKRSFGSHTVHTNYIQDGLFEYRLEIRRG